MDIPDLGYGYMLIGITKTYVQRRRYDSPLLLHETAGTLVQFDEMSHDRSRLLRRAFTVELDARQREVFSNADLDLAGTPHFVKHVAWDRSPAGDTWIGTRVRRANILFSLNAKDEFFVHAVEPLSRDGYDMVTYPNRPGEMDTAWWGMPA